MAKKSTVQQKARVAVPETQQQAKKQIQGLLKKNAQAMKALA